MAALNTALTNLCWLPYQHKVSIVLGFVCSEVQTYIISWVQKISSVLYILGLRFHFKEAEWQGAQLIRK